MATPTPDPNPRSWSQLTARAHAERPPSIDVRPAVRAALAAETPAAAAEPDWTESLFELLRLPWTRIALAGGCALALALCLGGWQTLTHELSDPIRLAVADTP